MTEEELTAEFGENEWKQLPDTISKRYRFIPAKVEIDEHHVGVYTSKKDGRILKANHPKALLHGSLVSPTIAAAIMNGKYVNAVPLYRLEHALFVYLKKIEPTVSASGQLWKAYTYILNQEKYLRVFLEDGEVPIDNNASERAIRRFCISRKNWQMIDTINGAHSSAIIYSIAETAEANNLKP